MITYKQFYNMLMKQAEGAPMVYHAGNLALDRTRDIELDKRARFALAMSTLGYALLWQRPNGIGYTYYVSLTRACKKGSGRRASFKDAEGYTKLMS